jgi:branched-chain amino acid transport system substrate-binding protein
VAVIVGGAVFVGYIEEGIDLAVEEVNAAGRPRFKVLYEDSQNQPREAVAVYNKLVATENPPVVVVALSSVAKAQAPLAEQSKTTLVYVAVAIPDIADGKYRFRVYPEAYGMAGVMAKFNTERLKAKTAAILYVNDDFGRVSLDASRREF